MKNQILNLKSRRVKILTKENQVFSGFIEQLNEDNLLLLDRFGQKVVISLSSIGSVVEVKDDI